MADNETHQESKYAKQAREILRGIAAEPDVSRILELTGHLKTEKAFGYARKLLVLARKRFDSELDEGVLLKLAQQHALCTFKDPDLPISDRRDEALEILDTADALKITENQETLELS